ncbi:MAG: hypothetical protein IJY09_00530 [Lachnospiraceae bacterium]|nr:hypothetical protein [Lachnospiraceae bacterium]
MKKNSTGMVWGILLILVGVGIGGKVLDLFDFDLFFDGWWTLFIIIPSAVRFFAERGGRISALGGLTIGILMLLAEQDFIEWSMLIPIILALVFILIGLRMIVSGDKKKQKANQNREYYREYSKEYRRDRSRENNRKPQWDNIEDAAEYYFDDEYDYNEEFSFGQQEPSGYAEQSKQTTNQSFENAGFKYNTNSQYYRYQKNEYTSTNFNQGARRNGHCACTAVLTGKEIRYHHEVFEGAMLSSVLGAIDLNLSEAILYQDVVIEAKVLLGGLEITVPKNVRVEVNATSIMGGVDNRVKRTQKLPDNAITIFVNVTCLMGGVEIK